MSGERKYFGTDGIRGLANRHPMTAEFAMKVGMAAGRHFVRGGHQHRVVIGKDTRLSSYMFEAALTAGFVSMGFEVTQLGPVPTPAIGVLTKSLRADLGVMISASHNPHQDNGIKLFGADGFKLSDEVETILEAYVDNGLDQHLVAADKLGSVKSLEDGRARYVEFAKATLARNTNFEGLKIVVDCANGAAYRTAPDMLWELGAEIIPVGVSPDGFNINENCGSTHPQAAQAKVLETGADLGICLDGDADRVHIIDEKGQVVDGDQIMALITSSLARRGTLRGGGLVATVMSNLGLETYLEGEGLKLERTKVGDRYVVAKMREKGYNIGGEQSGHVVLSDFVTTGDGAITALQVISEIKRTGRPASEVCRLFTPMPQKLENVRYSAGQTPLEVDAVKKVIADAEARLKGRGRLLIRKSGTEPLIRVMAECEDTALLNTVIGDVCGDIKMAVERGAAA